MISRSQPAVSRRLFRCLGAHLLRSPSTANPGQLHVTCLVATSGHTPPAENLGSPTSQFVLASRTSARCRVVAHSPSRSFRCSFSVSVVHRENKNPAHHRQAGLVNLGPLGTLSTCLPSAIWPGVMSQALIGTKAEHITARPSTTCRLRDDRRRSLGGQNVHAGSHRMCETFSM